MQIVELTGSNWPAVRTAVDFYEAGGMAAPKPKPRGKRSGEGRILTPGTISTGLEAFVDSPSSNPRTWLLTTVNREICNVSRPCRKIAGQILVRSAETPRFFPNSSLYKSGGSRRGRDLAYFAMKVPVAQPAAYPGDNWLREVNNNEPTGGGLYARIRLASGNRSKYLPLAYRPLL